MKTLNISMNKCRNEKKKKKNQIVLVNAACKVMFTLEFRNSPAEASLHFSLSLFLLFLHFVLNLITHFIVRKLFTKANRTFTVEWIFKIENNSRLEHETAELEHTCSKTFFRVNTLIEVELCVSLNIGTKKKRTGKKRSHDQFNRRFISYCQSKFY